MLLKELPTQLVSLSACCLEKPFLKQKEASVLKIYSRRLWFYHLPIPTALPFEGERRSKFLNHSCDRKVPPGSAVFTWCKFSIHCERIYLF